MFRCSVLPVFHSDFLTVFEKTSWCKLAQVWDMTARAGKKPVRFELQGNAAAILEAAKQSLELNTLKSPNYAPL